MLLDLWVTRLAFSLLYLGSGMILMVCGNRLGCSGPPKIPCPWGPVQILVKPPWSLCSMGGALLWSSWRGYFITSDDFYCSRIEWGVRISGGMLYRTTTTMVLRMKVLSWEKTDRRVCSRCIQCVCLYVECGSKLSKLLQYWLPWLGGEKYV